MALDFSKIAIAITTESRKKIVEEIIDDHDWIEEAEQVIEDGWISETEVNNVKIEENSQHVEVDVTVDVVESIPTSCRDINRTIKRIFTYHFKIDKNTGDISEDSLEDWEDDDDDYYPGDYV